MRVNDLTPSAFHAAMRAGHVAWSIGPFTVALQTEIPESVSQVRSLYGKHPLADTTGFVDFRIRVRSRRSLLRRVVGRQAMFEFGNDAPFHPFPRRQATPLFEWGLNWCIATNMHAYLLIHAAVVARDGMALVMPAPPGSGKSTLAAGLMMSGWRLLSDEFALVSPTSGQLWPVLKPISLKNAAIEILRARAHDHVEPDVYETRKGTVALMRPSAESIANIAAPARVRWIAAPTFERGATYQSNVLLPHESFQVLVSNSFNYSVLGIRGFHTLVDFVKPAASWQITYGDLDDALEQITRLAGRT